MVAGLPSLSPLPAVAGCSTPLIEAQPPSATAAAVSTLRRFIGVLHTRE
jgi:hypothetical protein